MEKAIAPNLVRPPINLQGGNDHPVVDLPFVAVIDGRQFRGRGLSLLAAYVAGLMDPAVLNTTRIVRLMFQFDGFFVSIVVDAEMREGAPGSGEVEMIFVNPTGPHLPQLRHILNAFIAGDLVGLGQTIGVAGTAAPNGSNTALPIQGRATLRRVVGAASVSLFSLALLAIAGTLAYQQMFVTLVPALGQVVSTAEVMRATATGQIVFLDLEARQGEVAVAIQANSGDVQSLILPCDCTITAQGLREGSTVLIGEPVLQLVSEADQRLVAAAIPPAMVFKLSGADQIELTFPSGATSIATTVPAQPKLGPVGSDVQTILLRAASPIPTDQIGQPVQIRIRHDGGRVGDWVTSLRDRAVNLFKGA